MISNNKFQLNNPSTNRCYMEANKPCNSGFSLPFFPLTDRRSHFLWFFENPNQPAKFFVWQIFIVDTELLAVKDNQLFIPTAFEIFDSFQIFFQFIGNGGLGRTLAVFFVGFPNILDNEIEVIKKLFPADKFHKICYLFDRRWSIMKMTTKLEL